ncbi:hypothetical protein FBUS_02376 [Fasciolopsis buskii]|uniref:Uncharacterized protein n=1 Tax=Fasciolopsis buskii TaxID=27845 RepID=A0A8E0VJC8_9TREM|nr:hypothetical protein FBUS_02376 [Fasciolopsis buski]
MSDTSTAQSNCHGLSNSLMGAGSSLSAKEFVELPLMSSYNNAFLETITEEGSEFEPSEDGSASFEQSDYLPFESVRVDQVNGSLVRVDPSLMIGELDTPDYEEVFPMPIQAFPTFHNNLIEYSNLLIPFAKVNCSDPFMEMPNVDLTLHTVSKQYNKDPEAPKHQTVPTDLSVNGGNHNGELIKTSDYQSYDEADVPNDGTDDWSDGLVLDQTPGRTQTLKRVGFPEPTEAETHLPDERVQWIDDQDSKEEVLILSTEDDKQLVWKLEDRDESRTTNQASLASAVEQKELRLDFPQKTRPYTTCCYSTKKNDELVSNPGKVSPNKVDKPNVNLNGSHPITAYDDKSSNRGEISQTIVETVRAPKCFTTQTSTMPTIPRPILPRIFNPNSVKTNAVDPAPIPPPKPQFPRYGFSELLLGQVKCLQDSLGLTAPLTPINTMSTRPPVPPRPSSKPVIQNANSLFHPTLSYRQLLSSTTNPSEMTRIPKSQSFQPDSCAQQFHSTNPFLESTIAQPLFSHGSLTLGSNFERFPDCMTSSYPGCGGQSASNLTDIRDSHVSLLTRSQFGPQSRGFLGQACVPTDQEDLMIENPAYMSTFFSEPHQNRFGTTHKRGETSGFNSFQHILTKDQPVTAGALSSSANYGPTTSGVNTGRPGSSSPSDIRSSEGDQQSETPATAHVLPPNSIQTDSQSKSSPVWIANSTPLAHYCASHSAISGKTDSNGANASKALKLSVTPVPENPLLSATELSDRGKSNITGVAPKPTNLTNSKSTINPRPIQRSFAVVGVSELLAKTDEELKQFMQDTEKKKISPRLDLTDELSNESSGNQLSSTSGGPLEHSPIRRRFQSNRVPPVVSMRLFDPVETESDSDLLDRRSFYDYGCDDDDEDDEGSNGNEVGRVASEIALHETRRGLRICDLDECYVTKPMTSMETDAILSQLELPNKNAQFVWSDSCHVASALQENKSVKKLDDTTSQWDMPFIDSDSFLNEQWNQEIGVDVWRLNYSCKPIRANLDEVTLTSGKYCVT